MEFASEMVVKATLQKLRLTEVPTTLSKDGRSRPPHLRTWRDGWRYLRFLLLYSPRWLFLYPGIGLFALGTAVALGVGAGSLLGFSFTVVSALVPLTVMVTALASIVYLHSRFVDQPEGTGVDEHQAWALANKLLPVTASQR